MLVRQILNFFVASLLLVLLSKSAIAASSEYRSYWVCSGINCSSLKFPESWGAAQRFQPVKIYGEAKVAILAKLDSYWICALPKHRDSNLFKCARVSSARDENFNYEVAATEPDKYIVKAIYKSARQSESDAIRAAKLFRKSYERAKNRVEQALGSPQLARGMAQTMAGGLDEGQDPNCPHVNGEPVCTVVIDDGGSAGGSDIPPHESGGGNPPVTDTDNAGEPVESVDTCSPGSADGDAEGGSCPSPEKEYEWCMKGALALNNACKDRAWRKYPNGDIVSYAWRTWELQKCSNDYQTDMAECKKILEG